MYIVDSRISIVNLLSALQIVLDVGDRGRFGIGQSEALFLL